MHCLDCLSTGETRDAVAICHSCGAALCEEHAHLVAHWLTHEMTINRKVSVEPPARAVYCGTCEAAHLACGDLIEDRLHSDAPRGFRTAPAVQRAADARWHVRRRRAPLTDGKRSA